MNSTPKSRVFAERLSQIVYSALQYKNLHDIARLLKEIAITVDAYGCILWIEDPSPYIKKKNEDRSLYVFADWFSDEIQRPIIELPMNRSANGNAIISGESKLIDDLQTHPETYKEDASLKDTQLTSMCIIPIKFDSEKTNASLSVYRRIEVIPFTPEEKDFIVRIARLIPSLYQAICDKVGRTLLSETHKILDNAERMAKAAKDDTNEIVLGLQKVCEKVGETFNCLETSLFLKNRLEGENQYKLFATTFPNWKDKNKILSPRKEEGLTGWILEKKVPIRIFNLSRFQEEKKELRKTYEEIDWKDSLEIGANARRYIELPKGSLLPPLSFMAMPIVRNEDLLGVIRCCTAKKSPWFFSEGQLDLLTMVSTHISRFWSDWLQYLEEKEENVTWQNFISKISELNAEVHKSIKEGNVDEDMLCKQMIELAENSISQEANISIKFTGNIEEKSASNSDLDEKDLKTPNNENFEHGDTHYYLHKADNNNKLLSIAIAENEKDNSDRSSELNKRDLLIPIDIHDDTVGVISIHTSIDKPLLRNAQSIAELLGQQLGLYLSLGRNERQQRQVFEDLWHQLKSPIGQTFARARSLFQIIKYNNWRTYDWDNIRAIQKEVSILRSIARKAKRVAVNAGVFTKLSTKGRLDLDPSKVGRLFRNDAQTMLTEGFQDSELLQDGLSIKHLLDKDGFSILEKIKVCVDTDLFEQAIGCLLDNANKYTIRGTTVRIEGGEETKEDIKYFYISVSSQSAVIIKKEDLLKVKERGIRGEDAKLMTGEGSGIGLWVVEHVMRAHKGALEIIPTTPKGWTEMKLLFPISE